MSTHASDADAADRDATDDRYAALRVAGAAMVIYDRSNHRAWVQSDVAVPIEDVA